jgi:Protein of unknown function (DUF3098)
MGQKSNKRARIRDVEVETTRQKISKRKASDKKAIWHYPLVQKNYMIFGIGLAVILVGYLLMMTGIGEDPALVDGAWNNPLAIGVAPVLLVIGYCVIIPYAILKYFGKKES